MGNPYNKHAGNCEYNIGVSCEELEKWKLEGMKKDWPCRKCGWRPEIEAQRKKLIYAKFATTTPGNKLDEIIEHFNKGNITKEGALRAFYFIRRAVFGE